MAALLQRYRFLFNGWCSWLKIFRKATPRLGRKALALAMMEVMVLGSVISAEGPVFPSSAAVAIFTTDLSFLSAPEWKAPSGAADALLRKSNVPFAPDFVAPALQKELPVPVRPLMFRPPLNGGAIFFQSSPPGISQVQPNSGAPGTAVTITGANFGTSQGAGTVTFNGAAATVSSWSNSTIHVTVPSGALSGPLKVTTSAGTASAGRFVVINPTGISVDQVVSGAFATPLFSTSAGNELLLAFISVSPQSGSSGGGPASVIDVTGGGLTWVLVKRTNVQAGSAEIWRAFSTAPLSNISVSPDVSAFNDYTVTIVSFTGVDTSGTNGSGAIGATGSGNGGSGTPAASLTTTRSGSVVFGVGEDPTSSTDVVAGLNQSIASQAISCTSSAMLCTSNDTAWTQQFNTTVAASGTAVTLTDTSPAADAFNFSTVEVLPASTPATRPVITSLSAVSASPGTSITITGANFGATQGTSNVKFNGTAATPTNWSNTSIVAPVPAGATTGNVVVTVSSQASNALPFIVANASGLAIDQIASGGNGIGAPISTKSGNEVLLLLVGTAPNGNSESGITVISPPQGGGLTWVQVEISDLQGGTAEVWRAFSPYILDNASINYNPTLGSDVSLTLISFIGADTTGTNGSGAIGAKTTASASTGAPTAHLTTTRANSFVFGVGSDTTAGISRTVGPNQKELSEAFVNNCIDFFCSPNSYTLWAQQVTSALTTSGTSVTVNDTAPTGDSYDLSILEIVPPANTTPSITSLSPIAGPVGTVVTITGTNFGNSQGTSSVTFAGVTATPTSWTNTSIVVPVPQSVSLGAAAVVVTVTGAGSSNSATFTVVAPLAITASVSPAANAAGWNKANVTISYTCTGGVTPVQCPSSRSVTTEGANQSFTATATDANNNQASVTTTLNIDKTAPALAITSPANNSTVITATLPVSGTVSDALSGISSVTCNGAVATVQSGTFSCSVTLAAGANTVTVSASDVAGNASTQSISVTLGPTITDFTPKTGPVGTAVSIQGNNLVVPPNLSTVTFTGSTGPVTAHVNFSSATQIAVNVPTGAITGPITITNSAGSAGTAVPFTVGARQDFQVTASPGTGTVPQGSLTSFAIAVTSQQTSFTQLAQLSVTGAPAGVSATFSPTQITAGATSSLRVDLGAANLQTGSYSFLVHAAATVDGVLQDRTASVVLNVTAAGPTTLAGQVVSTSNQPIVGATVSLDGLSVLTDGAGRFLLSGVQPGTNRSLSIDGHSASSPNATFPLIFEPVNVLAGRANVVSNAFHLPPIDTSQEVTINPNADTVAGNASVPNLQMTIPQGAHLRMLDGTLVTRTSITPLAPDRTPAPLPSDVGTNIVYTSQPGGAITDIPIPVVYPNLAGLNPGTEVELYAFDHAHVNWFVYGMGKVSTDGRTIAPEINPATGKPYGLPDFSWHFPNTGPNGNPSDPNGCPKSQGPHPVDYSTGMKIEKVPQVSWGGARGALKFGLVYTTDKTQSCDTCPFGRGWTHSWDIRMSGSFAPGGAGRVIFPDQVTGRLFSSSGTDANGTPRFTTTATVSQLGASVGGGVLFRGATTNQYRDPDGTTLYFNSSGRLIAKVDANGNTTTLDYTNGNLTKITDAVGRSLTFIYDSSNRVISMTDPLNRTWHYTYEGTPGVAGAPGLTTITDPAGNVTRYTYVTGGRIAQMTDARGNVSKRITYDLNGRVASQTFADGGTETYTYQLSGTIVTSTTVKNPVGVIETRRFNAGGYVIGITDGSGQTATIQRDLTTNVVLSTVGSCGCNQTQRTYSTAGDVTNSSNATGGLWLRNYDPVFHVVTTVKDPLNNPTTYTYDLKGNLLTKLDALQQTTTYGYDGFGELTSIQTPSGGTSQINYDPQGNIISTVDPAGKITNFEYDGMGHITAVVDPLQRRSTMQYDERYRLISTTDPALNITRYEYDANGNRTAIVNPLGKRWTYAYDSRNRLISRTDPLGHTRSYIYDAAGHLLSAKTPLGRITSYTYTPRGQIASKTAPNGDTVKFDYDASGNVIKITDARGNTISYTYDASNRLTSRTDPLGRTGTITYDVAGNVTSRVDRFGRQTTYTYDVLNRPVRVNYSDATVNITYDGDGRIAQKDDSIGGSIHWDYDDRGLPIAETTAQGIVDYTYNDAGQQVSAGIRGRVATQYGYDAFGRLGSISFGTKSFSFQYDQASRRTAVTRANGITSAYTYDDANRLIHITHANSGGVALEDLAYTIDDDGRLTSTQSTSNHTLLPASATSGTFDANNRPTQFNGNLLSFDDLGELISNTGQSSTTYQWDGRGRLISAHLPNGSVVQYSYDAMNRLASRSVNGAATNYLYNGSEVLLRTDSLGNQTDFVNGASQTERLLQTGGGSDLYFLQDRLSNVISLANSSGGVVEQESYEPFGNTTGSAFTEYGYIGERLDPDAHLMILNARFYDPIEQRFVTEDPIGTAGGMNVFAYAGNDPVNALDPSGMMSSDEWLYYSAQFFAGAGDKLSFGFTNWVRDKMGTNDVIDKCSLTYQAGGYTGDVINYSIQVLSVVGPLVGAGAAAAETVEAVEAIETEAGLAADAETTAEEVASEAEEVEASCARCFPAGTQVVTSTGPVAIEKIKVGDKVLSRNIATGKSEYKKVKALTKPHQDRLLELHIQGEREALKPTREHPFWAKRGDKDASWIKAGNLQLGDLLFTVNDRWSKVTAIKPLEDQQTVYNFEVDDNHDYYVGSPALLVHNSGACDIARKAAQGFKYGECVDCANAVEKALVEAGESGTRISINAGDGYLVSDLGTAGENIATNGIHEAVETGGRVFDNITPNGVPLSEWLNSIHSANGPIVNFITTRPF